MWWYMPIIPALGGLWKENPEFNTNIELLCYEAMGCIARPCLKKKLRSVFSGFKPLILALYRSLPRTEDKLIPNNPIPNDLRL
jgi:hypothetical protein